MDDDRILVHLVLNEATASAVEGRVRNLVNRLNSQSITLNINGTNLANVENRLANILQQMHHINSTPVNINANYNAAQQQYHLETERLRVSQRIELSRQRTLQTENLAIQALAEQNQTLTINNNVTHQVEQGTQNIGNNMQAAGGHARNFVDYLSDGVRYILVYRSLYALMNQFSKSFSEMANVDKELIAVRKTTGMTEREIEKIRKASYGVATEYGRTASEYLGSVSEFARGGYKELSTELAKVSLLTQNVGDVNQETADSMLLSIDAAYGLKGSVSELTNVVNGLNNIANLNPTSMQKMSEGMQVSASMAKVVGLEISELVALIGTGTAVTQREGGEISRAIRTILMNIRAQKGELEDGTIIDADSIAKAEKALNGVGIATKKVINGVRELRDPMDILDELAGKWHTLNSEAQSVVLESLVNKRQANILAAILENYEMVGKMQNEYFNSANSAIRENELYLQGWEATQKRTSAKFTEFIANLADTSLIIGTLNALYDVLIILDTPLGRLVTQIVLFNTALAVTGRLWQAIRTRSMIADILALGVAERNLGGAVQLVTRHLGEQALAFASTPIGMATIAIAGIQLITSAIEQHSQTLEEHAQKTGEALEKMKSELAEVDGLINEYNELQLSGEWDNTSFETKKKLQEDINRLLGSEAEKIDIINGKYKETAEELFKQRMAKAPEEEKTAFDNEQAKGKTLWDEVYWNNHISTSYTSVLSDAEEQYLDKYTHIFSSDTVKVDDNDEHNYVLQFSNFNDFMYKYEEAKKLLQEMYDGGLGESQTYKYLNTFIANFDTKVSEYKSAVDELSRTQAGNKLYQYMTNNIGGYIDNIDEYNQVIAWINENFASDDKNSALAFLNTYFSEYADKINIATGQLDKAVVSLSEIKKASEGIHTLQKAFTALSKDGYITLETMSNIKSATGLSGDEWEEYQAILLKSKVGTEEFNRVMTELTYATLSQQLGTDNLAHADEAFVEAVLRENGVLNANAVAHDIVSFASHKEATTKAEAALAAYANGKASVEETKQLLQESGSAIVDAEAMEFLNLAQTVFNNTTLNIEDKKAKLQELGIYANWTADQIGKIADTTLTYSDGKWWVNHYEEDKDKNGELDYLYSEEYKGFEFTMPEIVVPDYSGADTSSSSKNEALDNYLKEAERRYKIHQDETKYINDLNYALSTLVKTEDERLDVIGKIDEAYRDLADNRIKDIEHEIEMLNNLDKDADSKTLIERYRHIQKIAHDEAQRLRNDGYDDNSNEIQEMQKTWWDAEKDITDTKRDEFDERLKLSEDYIEYSKKFGWQNGDNEIKARQRIKDWMEDEYYRSLIEDDEEYYEILNENRLSLDDMLRDRALC